MGRYLLIAVVGLTFGIGSASAQGFGYQYNPNPTPYVNPYAGPGQYLQNYYNRGNQPLSPYLNLLRNNGDPGINYYYGVRPGTQAGGQPFSQYGAYGGGQQSMLMNSQMRQGYLPQAGNPSPEPQPIPEAGQEVVLPASGHPVMYGNNFGISRTGVPGVGAGSRNNFFAPPKTGTQTKAPPKK